MIMSYITKLLLFRTFLGLMCMIALILVAGFKVKNLALVFTLMVGLFALIDSNYLRNNQNSFREWTVKRFSGNEKIELMTKGQDKIISIEKYLSIFMLLLSIVLIVYPPIKTGSFLRPNNLVGLITLVIGIGMFFGTDRLVKNYFSGLILKPWIISSFKFSSIIVAIVGIAMILFLRF
jgi:hypothetical protein